MGYLVKRLAIGLSIFAFSASSFADSITETYKDLQDLKFNVQAAYVNALIVDKDSRAHTERVKRIDQIESVLNKIDNLKNLDPKHLSALSTGMRIYLRSAKNEAATYDINLGSRTFNNGYSSYSELIEHIYAPIQLIEASESIPKKSIEAFTLMDTISEAIEIHGERIINTERVEKLTQTHLDTICATIESGLKNMAKHSDSQRTIKKASLKWTFIKAPVCNLDKSSAPYTITHYGFLMTDIIRRYATDNLNS